MDLLAVLEERRLRDQVITGMKPPSSHQQERTESFDRPKGSGLDLDFCFGSDVDQFISQEQD
jgi:hypothetical protein